MGRGDLGTRGSGDMGLGEAGTWDSETREGGDMETWDLGDARIVGLGGARTSGLGPFGDSRTWDVWTRGRDKQTAPEFLSWICNLQFSVVKRKVLYAGEFVNRPVADDCKRP